MINWLVKWSPAFGIVCLIVGAWQLLVKIQEIPSWLLPSPSSVATTIYNDHSMLMRHTIVTLEEIILGFFLALCVGVILASAICLSQTIEKALYPFIIASQTVPIIVIAPSQKPQSKSTVGTSVTVYDESVIGKSNDYFLGDALGNSTTSFNYFQTGGHGMTSGIQLRGLPKRYSTVYIDGVRQSDPSSVSDDYDFNHLLMKVETKIWAGTIKAILTDYKLLKTPLSIIQNVK